MSELSEQQKKLIKYLSSDDTILEYQRTFNNGENIFINVSDPNDDNSFFYVTACDDFSVRAHYKLPGMDDESTIVVEVNNRTDNRCDLYIRSLDFTLKIRS